MTWVRAGWAAVVAVALLALAGSGLTAASATSPEAAAARLPVEYVALGDSYASGYGVPPYSACGRSHAAYAERVGRLPDVRLSAFVACAGATTASVRSTGQLESLDRSTGLVTVTVGGNDVAWGEAVAACLGGTDRQCSSALAIAIDRVASTLPRRLAQLYAQIAARAPRADVLVVGYPRLFSPARPSLLASPGEQRALNRGADLLDSVIADAARRRGFTFVDVRGQFADHGANAADPWILGPFDPAPFHPNAAGYRAYASAVAQAAAHALS